VHEEATCHRKFNGDFSFHGVRFGGCQSKFYAFLAFEIPLNIKHKEVLDEKEKQEIIFFQIK